ncbi:MATE family efflux transporter [Ammoniphilus resinae]|uniref:Probable multidrug resistance protein NorM n=1 Tax=Ammoniphilus resinae TaxID=861532 RepID=A0ABS4GNB3_9BACL|nr:MATE family efflux transporter [Ammoniphilus resinae]MBP1931753.1 MATE family multidrug resistance protein [Ammoniphilus resinae]
MKQTHSAKQKIKQLFYILFPILVTQVSLFGMNFFDTVMSGHVSARDLAGVAIGASIWSPIFTGLCGIIMALTPIISQLVGADQKEKVSYQVIQGIYLAVAIAISIIIIGACLLDPILGGMGVDPEVKRIAYHYLLSLAWGIVPLFIYTALRCFMDALGQTVSTMVISLLSLPINVALNYVLIFGKLGFPTYGGVGAGIASAITYWCILLIAVFVVWRKKPFRSYHVFHQAFPLSFRTWKEQLVIGIPIGFSIFFETSIFAAVTLLMSNYTTETVAAHQAAINFASLVYMMPMSISLALTIAVGFEVGAERLQDARQYSRIGISFSTLMSIFSAIGLLVFHEQIAGMYTTDPTVLALTKHFLMYAIFFQLSDGIAAPIQGALRGYKDVNATFVMAFISYWVLGLPIGLFLAKFTSIAAYGYWIGLISGLAFGAVFLSIRLWKIQHPGKQHFPLRKIVE